MSNPITQLYNTYNRLGPHEQIIVWVLSAVLVVGAVGLLADLQERFSTRVPQTGGQYTEGVVGFPRYVNPVLANTSADEDVSRLVYAGLMKRNESGEVVPDLATRVTADSDRTSYTFSIDPDARFHDGHPVRSEDVVFTIRSIKNAQIDSPKRSHWQGVTVSAENDTTVTFDLDTPFAGLPANATVGILPKHLWQDESAQSFPFARLNTRPVGAGPYQVVDTQRNADGVPTTFKLEAFTSYTGNRPHIQSLVLQFFADNQKRRQAYERGSIDGMASVDPAYAKTLTSGSTSRTTTSRKISSTQDGDHLATFGYNRVFSVFFNGDQNQALVDQSVREALSISIPKGEIVDTALAGYGSSISGPLPPDLLVAETNQKQSTSTATTSVDEQANAQTAQVNDGQLQATATSSIEKAESLLAAAGWERKDGVRTKDEKQLQITLTTADVPALRKAVNLIADRWGQLGVNVETQSLPTGDLTRKVIRPRDYQALLFGQSVSSRRDLYSFWHSSRQDDPGLNFAQYTNSSVDTKLEALRSATSSDTVRKLTKEATKAIREDRPAAFVFSPSFIYVLPDAVDNINVPPVVRPADRFAEISSWYTDTQLLWDVFSE